MLEGLTNSEGIPALQRMMQFAGQRHRVILNNIANLSTPGFRPSDVSPEAFQQQLAEAIDRRAARADFSQNPAQVVGIDGQALGIGSFTSHSRAQDALPLRSTREVETMGDRLILHPTPTGDNILFHDGNDRSVERVMQDLVENFLAFRTAAQLLRSRIEILNTAISQRV